MARIYNQPGYLLFFAFQSQKNRKIVESSDFYTEREREREKRALFAELFIFVLLSSGQIRIKSCMESYLWRWLISIKKSRHIQLYTGKEFSKSADKRCLGLSCTTLLLDSKNRATKQQIVECNWTSHINLISKSKESKTNIGKAIYN